jgi:hypothetical protein
MASYEITCFSAPKKSEADVHATTDDELVVSIRLSYSGTEQVKSGKDIWFKVPTNEHEQAIDVTATFENSAGYVAGKKSCKSQIVT